MQHGDLGVGSAPRVVVVLDGLLFDVPPATRLRSKPKPGRTHQRVIDVLRDWQQREVNLVPVTYMVDRAPELLRRLHFHGIDVPDVIEVGGPGDVEALARASDVLRVVHDDPRLVWLGRVGRRVHHDTIERNDLAWT